MARIVFEKAGVRFPFYFAEERSLKRNLVGLAGNERTHVPAIAQLDLSIAPGSRMAVLGGNGSGKTTLLRLAAGLLQPSQGRVAVEGRPWAVANVGLGPDPDFSAAETVQALALLQGHAPAAARRCADAALDFAGIEDAADMPVKLLGPGQRLRLGTGIAVALGADILLFDEMLENAGPDFFAKICAYLADGFPADGIVLAVERSRALLHAICRDAVVLERGRIAAAGSLDDVLERHGSQHVF